MIISPNISKAKRLYVNKDAVMKSVITTAWGFYEMYQEKLVKFNSVYTKEYGEEQLRAIELSGKLGSCYAMRAPSMKLRLEMETAGKTCTRNFKAVKRYIYHLGYEGTVLKQHYTQAGQPYFTKATNQNWESMEKLNKSVLDYLDENRLKLLQKGNMPPGFIDKVKQDAALFKELLQNFGTKRKITDIVGVKITALNAIYKTGIAMMIDAQLALEGIVPANIFSYNHLLKSIHRKKKRTTGVVKTADNVRVPYARIIVEQNGEEVKTIRANKKGEFKTCAIDGDMILRIVAKGMVTEIIEAIGEEKKHLNIVMRAA